MPDPIKMPAPPLAPDQIEVKLGGKRYVLNAAAFMPPGLVSPDAPVRVVKSFLEDPPHVERIDTPMHEMKFHRDAFALVWPPLGEDPKP
jgi:hypothetical protein